MEDELTRKITQLKADLFDLGVLMAKHQKEYKEKSQQLEQLLRQKQGDGHGR